MYELNSASSTILGCEAADFLVQPSELLDRDDAHEHQRMLPPLPQTFSAPSFSSPCCLRLRFVHQSLLHDYTILIFAPIESTLRACAVATSSTATTRRSCTARLASSTGTRSLCFRHPGVGAGQQGLGAWLRARSDRVVLVSTAGSPVTRILQVHSFITIYSLSCDVNKLDELIPANCRYKFDLLFTNFCGQHRFSWQRLGKGSYRCLRI